MKAVLKLTAATLTLAFAGTMTAHAETIVSVTQTSYNFRDQPVCAATRMNPAIFSTLTTSDNPCALKAAGTFGADRITKAVYDSVGQVTQTIQAYGTSAQRTYSTVAYSNNGKVTDSIDANGNRTHMVYDGFDRLTELDYPSTTRPGAFNPATQATALATAGAHNTVICNTTNTADCEAYQYDANGNRTWERRRDKRAMNYQYDALNRRTIAFSSDASIRSVHTIYDLQNQILKKLFDGFTGPGVSYVYDGLGRVTSTTDMNGRPVSYQYNLASARTRLTMPDATYLTYGLDNANRVINTTHSTAGSLFSQGYDNLGSRTYLTKAGGGMTYGYDAFGRLTTMTDDLASTADDITWTFSGRNPAGQITSWGATSANYDYTETTASTLAQTYDGLNRDAAIATVSGGYDARGNLTQDAPDGTMRVFAYDILNRLLTKKPSLNGTADMTLTYDPEGRLSSYATSSGTTTFLYDGVNLIAEYSSAGTVLETYVHGTGDDEPVVWFHNAGYSSRRYFVTNYQGSVIGWTNNTGVLQEKYIYDPYGKPMETNAWTSSTRSRFAYTGQTMLKEAKLYYYKARVYDPMYGHFLQTDPIGTKDDLDLYAYVGDDPINSTDPDGQQQQRLYVAPFSPAQLARVQTMRQLDTQIRAINPNHPSLSRITPRNWVPSPTDIRAQREVLTGLRSSSASGNGLPTLAFSRSVMPGVAGNVEAAFSEGYPSILNRNELRNAIRATRRGALRGHATPPEDQSLDEFPFASTIQGGAGARVAPVPSREQNIQGGQISSFYRINGIKHGDPFKVIVTD